MANPRKRRMRQKLIEEKKEVAEALGYTVISKELLLTLPDKVVTEEKKEEKVVEKPKPVIQPVLSTQEKEEEVLESRGRGRPKKTNEK